MIEFTCKGCVREFDQDNEICEECTMMKWDDPQCSCHNNPPCSCCVEYSYEERGGPDVSAAASVQEIQDALELVGYLRRYKGEFQFCSNNLDAVNESNLMIYREKYKKFVSNNPDPIQALLECFRKAGE